MSQERGQDVHQIHINRLSEKTLAREKRVISDPKMHL